ncbi:LuxR C-terminal-related transcriptional regulator [Herpetosiphon gulosus]|uniref:HTH-type transcriptional regulator MalT n=1 Tax=Herpetosiphon gulosus TaxID=1973496 RepID=A0ABP9WZQ1_9CHLR
MLQLIQTKLVVPPPRERVVKRSRLYQRLDAGRNQRLTLISAPAGFGKTTLVSAWLHTTKQQHCVWLTLNSHDNDPLRFAQYLQQGFQAQLPQFNWQWLELLGHQVLINVVTTLINQLHEQAEQWVLVLDDYQMIDHPVIHEALTMLIEHCPPQLHMVLTCRQQPALPLARWRARNWLNTIGVADLRFTDYEGGEFLRDVMHVRLNQQIESQVLHQSAGWIAGLQLAALALSEAPSPEHGLRALNSGQASDISVYLLEEVFQQQPTSIQQALLALAPLDRFNRSLADFMHLQRELGSSQLDQIIERQLFIGALDQEWWQLHPLFRDFLLQHANLVDPELRNRVLALAAEWCRDQHYIHDAMHYALQAQAHQLAAAILTPWVGQFVREAAFYTLRPWLDQLPIHVIWNEPRLCIAQMWILITLRNGEGIQGYLERISQLVGSNEPNPLAAEALALGALAATMTSKLEQAALWGEQAKRLNTSNDPTIQGVMTFCLAVVAHFQGDAQQAEMFYQQTETLGQTINSRFLSTVGAVNRAGLLHDIGQFSRAEQICLSLIEQAQALPAPRPFMAGMYWMLARIYHQRHQLPEALVAVEQSLNNSKIMDNRQMWCVAQAQRVAILQSQNDYPQALHCLLQLEEYAIGHDNAKIRLIIQQTRCLLAIEQHDLAQATQWLALINTDPEDLNNPINQWLGGLLALRQAALDQAASLLNQALTTAERINFVPLLVSIYATLAMVLARQGQLPKALEQLQHALTIAEPELIIQPLLDLQAGLIPLLQQLPSSPLVLRLLHHNRLETLDLAITPREHEILRYLAAGLGNRAIAEALVIAESTLKRHISNLYLKLDVHNRTAAIVKAREQGLID